MNRFEYAPAVFHADESFVFSQKGMKLYHGHQKVLEFYLQFD